MDSVTVAELKSKLSHYLREVRGGRSFTVLSRDIPVAILGPYQPEEVDDLVIIEPTEDPALWGKVDLPPLALSRDVVRLAASRTRGSEERGSSGRDAVEAGREKRQGARDRLRGLLRVLTLRHASGGPPHGNSRRASSG